MLQYFLVRLPLPVLEGVEVFRVRGGVVAWFESGEVALNVSGGTASSRSGKPDVGGH